MAVSNLWYLVAENCIMQKCDTFLTVSRFMVLCRNAVEAGNGPFTPPVGLLKVLSKLKEFRDLKYESEADGQSDQTATHTLQAFEHTTTATAIMVSFSDHDDKPSTPGPRKQFDSDAKKADEKHSQRNRYKVIRPGPAKDAGRPYTVATVAYEKRVLEGPSPGQHQPNGGSSARDPVFEDDSSKERDQQHQAVEQREVAWAQPGQVRGVQRVFKICRIIFPIGPEFEDLPIDGYKLPLNHGAVVNLMKRMQKKI